MPRYRLTFEFDMMSDQDAERRTEKLQACFPDEQPLGIELEREAVRPWKRVEVILLETMPARRPPKAV